MVKTTQRRPQGLSAKQKARLRPVVQGELTDEATITRARISSGLDQSLHLLSLESCLVEGARVGHLSHARFVGCDLQRIDAANAPIEESFIADSVIREAHLIGWRANRLLLRNVTFRECTLELAQLQHATLEKVAFRNCRLRGTFFNHSSLAGTIFDGCDLTGADFTNADFSGSDLRGSLLDDIRVAPNQFTDVIVTSDQAIFLARLFGLKVRDDVRLRE